MARPTAGTSTDKPSQHWISEERKTTFPPKSSKDGTGMKTRSSTIAPPQNLRKRGRPRKKPGEVVPRKLPGKREIRQDSQAAVDPVGSEPRDARQVTNGVSDALDMLPLRLQISYDALAPRGLADYLEGDLHIDQLRTHGSADPQQGPASDGRAHGDAEAGEHLPFVWNWDRPLPDIATGIVNPRTGPVKEENGRTFFWDIKKAKWQPVEDAQAEIEKSGRKYFAADLEENYRRQRLRGLPGQIPDS